MRQTKDDDDIQVYNVKDVVNIFEILLCFDQFSKSDHTFETNDVFGMDDMVDWINEKVKVMMEKITDKLPR